MSFADVEQVIGAMLPKMSSAGLSGRGLGPGSKAYSIRLVAARRSILKASEIETMLKSAREPGAPARASTSAVFCASPMSNPHKSATESRGVPTQMSNLIQCFIR